MSIVSTNLKGNCSDAKDLQDITNILSLDDDSLLYVFQYLSLKDQLSLICAHERFEITFQMYCKAKIKKIFEDDFHYLTPLEIRYLFKSAGEYLETLQLPADFEKTKCDFGFTLVKLYCPNLKNLSLLGQDHNTTVYYDRLRELLINKPKLRTLRLHWLRIKDIYVNLMLESELPQLEHLSIVDCHEFLGFSLKKMAHLKKLRLENLPKLNFTALEAALSVMKTLYAFSYCEPYLNNATSEAFIKVLNNLKLSNQNLQILELNMCKTKKVFVNMLPKLKHFTYGIREGPAHGSIDFSDLWHKKNQLESLKIVSDYDFEFKIQHCRLIAQFNNLQKLHLPWKDYSQHGININDDALRQFCVLQNVVEFKACGLHLFTKNGLLDLVRNCQKLKWVNISCTLIDNEFARELIPVIKQGGNRPNGRITFLVYGSKMSSKDFPLAYNSLKNKQSLKFIFKGLRSLESYNNFYDQFEHDSYLIQTPFCRFW